MSAMRVLDPVEKALFNAIANGDQDTVRRLVDEDPGRLALRSSRHFDGTVVTAALNGGSLAMVDLLLSLGADINAGSTWWAGAWRPIHNTINPARDELAGALIERGAEIDAHAAAGLGDMARLEALVDADPTRVHARGGDGCTPLHFARTAAVVDFLLDHGARIDARDIDHESTPLQWSAHSRPDVGAHLAERGARSDVFLWTALDDAERLGGFLDAHPDALESRTDHDPFRTVYSDAQHIYCYHFGSNATALHASVERDSAAAARVLLERGLDPDVRGAYDDSTPLHSAAWKDSVEVARVLLEGGAGVDTLSGREHNTAPLVWAILPGSVRVIELLLEHGAVVTDEVRSTADAGVRGEFREFNRDRSIEDRQRIVELLATR